nr:XRE family transcriptional regulator [Paenibacillus sp. A3M_27_13]
MIGTTRNKIAVESKTRPATILDLASGDTKTIKLETLVNILNAINEIARSHGLEQTFGIEDIIQYVPQSTENTR